MSKALGEHEFIVGDATSPPLKENSVHAIVCDPPYALGESGFMNQEWDSFGDGKTYQKWCEKWAKANLEVLKPGGHILAFSGSYRFHRLMTGIEDAGFELRDTLMWLYGGGFPKNHDISKAIDKKLGLEREVVGIKPGHGEFAGRDTDGHLGGENTNEGYKRPWMEKEDADKYHMKTAPASDIAKEFSGFGTALKPAFEPIVLARKPLEESTIAENVMKFGTGGLNIDECRISLSDNDHLQDGIYGRDGEKMDTDDVEGQWGFKRTNREAGKGRHPANVILDEESAEILDNQVGESKSSKTSSKGGWDTPDVYNDRERPEDDGVEYERGFNDSGGPSRFFYTAKARKSERTHDGKIENSHPTVKPVDLMEWLVKLVTKEGQTVLDPFMGSGTTLLACDNTYRKGIGIDMNPEWVEISKKRMLANRGRLKTNSIQDW